MEEGWRWRIVRWAREDKEFEMEEEDRLWMRRRCRRIGGDRARDKG